MAARSSQLAVRAVRPKWVKSLVVHGAWRSLVSFMVDSMYDVDGSDEHAHQILRLAAKG